MASSPPSVVLQSAAVVTALKRSGLTTPRNFYGIKTPPVTAWPHWSYGGLANKGGQQYIGRDRCMGGGEGGGGHDIIT